MRIESEIARLAGKSAKNVTLEGKTISQLIDVGRQSARRQYEYLCALVNDAEQKMQEIFAKPPKLPPATQELLRFNRPGSARIVEWFKQPGEIIQPGEAVFSFHYEGSTKVMPWSLRGRAAVRMTARAGNHGTWVSSDNPYLFEHIAASVQITSPNRVQKLREDIENVVKDVEDAQAQLQLAKTEAQKAKTELNQITSQHRGIAIPGVGILLASVIAAVAGFSLLYYFGHWGYGILPIVAGAYFANIGNNKRKAYQDKLNTLRQTAEKTEQELSLRLAEAKQHEQKLASLRDELAIIETACEDAKTRARDALGRFEGVSLRKGGKLLPFPSIFSARVGDVVRVFDRQLDRIKNESSREIELRDDLHEWLMADGKVKAKAHLLRVMEESPKHLVLSHLSAYTGAKANP